ncbi:MAG: hypothetical protein IPN01_08835 [Deltaproteobacteria bacterium]|nr:hypothetical protein [Deltaproteobacteria bacterium]
MTTRVVITVVETEDPSILREVFFRINYSGKKPNLNESLHLHFLESSLIRRLTSPIFVQISPDSVLGTLTM